MPLRDQPVRLPTVLCVDDEHHVLNALDRVLHGYDCRVLLASDGWDALDLLEQEEIDVLICDAAMPGMDGLEVLREATTIAPATVRILLTAHCSNEEVVIPAVNEGEIFRLLSKPWDDGELRRTVADALGLEPKAWLEQQHRLRERDRNGDART